MSTGRFFSMICVALVASAPACRQTRAGDDCKVDGRQRCTDKASALVCVDGRWEALACRGPTGCTTSGGDVDCSNEGYESGEFCDPASDDYVCSVDKKTALKCVAKRWAPVDRCLGPGGCVVTAKEVNCDDSVSEPGAACQPEGDLACAGDRASTLECKAGVMVAHQLCRGGLGCRKQGNKIACDDSVAGLGDACHIEGDASCSGDKLAMLTCRSGKMAFSRSCVGGCHVLAGEIDCK
jgi:hypothetical protein